MPVPVCEGPVRGITCNHLQRCNASTFTERKSRMVFYYRPLWDYVSSHMSSSPSINRPNSIRVSGATLIYTCWRCALDLCSIKLFTLNFPGLWLHEVTKTVNKYLHIIKPTGTSWKQTFLESWGTHLPKHVASQLCEAYKSHSLASDCEVH